MQQQFQQQLQLQAQQAASQAASSGVAPISAPALHHADTFLSADAVPDDPSSEDGEHFFRQ